MEAETAPTPAAKLVESFELMAANSGAQRPTDEQVWVAMWTCVASCFNCQDAAAAARWADRGLQQFRERFPNSA